MGDFRKLDELLQRFVDEGLPGCSCTIAKKGEILYDGYFGYSDVENKVPLNDRNVFRQASLTKVAMYTMAMKLFEQGKFKMTDPLYEYFPEWKNTMKRVYLPDGKVEIVPVEKPITVKNIMNMTMGMPYQMFTGQTVAHPVAREMTEKMQPLIDKGYYTLREQIKAVAEVPIAFEPGTHWMYGFASELTAGLLEVIEQKPAELVIKEQLFEPLGMDSSANFIFGDLGERLVKNYYFAPGKKLGDPDAYRVMPADREAGMAGPLGTVSGFQRVITNSRDYTKLLQMLANGGMHDGERIMGKKTIELMATNTLSRGILESDFRDLYNDGYGYGYGVRVLMDKYQGHCNGSIGQFGWTGGTGTWAEADPSEGVSIVYMHNLQPNMEQYFHLRMRAVAQGCLD